MTLKTSSLLNLCSLKRIKYKEYGLEEKPGIFICLKKEVDINKKYIRYMGVEIPNGKIVMNGNNERPTIIYIDCDDIELHCRERGDGEETPAT